MQNMLIAVYSSLAWHVAGLLNSYLLIYIQFSQISHLFVEFSKNSVTLLKHHKLSSFIHN